MGRQTLSVVREGKGTPCGHRASALWAHPCGPGTVPVLCRFTALFLSFRSHLPPRERLSGQNQICPSDFSRRCLREGEELALNGRWLEHVPGEPALRGAARLSGWAGSLGRPRLSLFLSTRCPPPCLHQP